MSWAPAPKKMSLQSNHLRSRSRVSAHEFRSCRPSNMWLTLHQSIAILKSVQCRCRLLLPALGGLVELWKQSLVSVVSCAEAPVCCFTGCLCLCLDMHLCFVWIQSASAPRHSNVSVFLHLLIDMPTLCNHHSRHTCATSSLSVRRFKTPFSFLSESELHFTCFSASLSCDKPTFPSWQLQ